jgi:hypothetical protein
MPEISIYVNCVLQKVKKLSLCLMKYHSMKTYEEMEI